MSSRTIAIALVVVGVVATLGGVFGQVFLAEDDGHHDGRSPTFALQSELGADELVVDVIGPGRLLAEVTRAGQPIGREEIHGAQGHYFVVGADLDHFEHVEVLEPLGPVALEAPSGEVRVIAQVQPDGGPDLLELGRTVEVPGSVSGEQDITDDDRWTNGSITVTREGLDFVVSAPWNGDEVFGAPALLSLVRADDLGFVHAHAELVGQNRFSFATDLPGLGDYLAAVEFEQDGEDVVALFRFTL